MSKVTVIKILLYLLLIIINGCIPALSSQYLAESDHPYGNNYDNTWTIEEHGADKIKLHFKYLKLAEGLNNWGAGDKLIISSKYGDELDTIESVTGINYEDYWTNWYPGDKLQIRLVTDTDSKVSDGFIIDKDMASNETDSSFESEDTSKSPQYLAKSDYPYRNNYDNTWTIEEPGVDKIKLHFKYLKLAEGLNNWGLGDKLIISDKYGDELETIESVMGINYENYWTNWYPGDKLQIRLVTDDSKISDGFIIDKDMVSNDTNNSFESEDTSKSPQYLAESDHPYANNDDKTWTIQEPGADKIRIHFKDLRLAKTEELPNYDELLILDTYGNVVETYGTISGLSKQDFWTGWYKGDKLTIELVTDKKRSCYGFVVDRKDFEIDNSSSENVDTEDSKTAESIKIQSDSAVTSENKASTNNESTSSADNFTIKKNISKENSNVKPPQTYEEPIWDNPIISGTIATVLGAIIIDKVKKRPPKDENGNS